MTTVEQNALVTLGGSREVGEAESPLDQVPGSGSGDASNGTLPTQRHEGVTRLLELAGLVLAMLVAGIGLIVLAAHDAEVAKR